MSPKQLILIAVAAVAAAIAGFLAFSISSRPEPVVVEAQTEFVQVEVERQVEVAEVRVLVADMDLELGRPIEARDLRWANWPESAVNVGYYTDADNPDAIEDLEGSIVRLQMFENDPILPQRIIKRGEGGYMAAILTPGKRAIAVEISTERASGGFILPNDRVDVILVHEIVVVENEFSVERPVSETILRNVRVLAIDQEMRQDEGRESEVGSVATLELTEQETELVALAERMGTLTLALRGVQDSTEFDGEAVASYSIMDGSATGGTGINLYRNGEAASASGS